MILPNGSEADGRSHTTLIGESAEFALAVDALSSGQFVRSSALILDSLWGALEALFSPSTTELKFRVSSLIAAFLEPFGNSRGLQQKQIAKLYDKRSAAPAASFQTRKPSK